MEIIFDLAKRLGIGEHFFDGDIEAAFNHQLAPSGLTVRASAEVRKAEGLLTNDSFIVAYMREQGLTKLATANGDFDRIDGIEVYKPTDLEGEDTL